MTDFKWRHFQGDVILWAVRWYCRYPISYRDLEEMLAERGISVGTVAKLAMRQPFVLFKGLTFQKLCLPGAFRPGDHHNK
ncbi:hypothetical protein LDY62_19105, partial [Acinetobacter baumannii]|nr:hypothetical protein [Acinetobacter baumannii]